MHTLFNVSGLLVLILLGSMLILFLLQYFSNWSQRQVLQLFVLGMPLVILNVLIGGLQHVLNHECIFSAPSWDFTLDVIVLVLMGATLLGALSLGLGRLVLMQRIMRDQHAIIHPELQVFVDRFAHQRGISRLRLRLVRSDGPLALLVGMWRPTILLSTWMVEYLDRQELEAVLAHELIHAWRRDYLKNWVALMLRDAFFYLPTSRITYRQMRREKDLACDDLVARITQQPLALASALTKVWLHLVDDSPSVMVQALVGGGESISTRIDRLLGNRDFKKEKPSRALFSLALSASIGATLLVNSLGIALAITEFFCWHVLLP